MGKALKMNGRYLIDTDVLIDYLRSHSSAVDFLEHCPGDLLISPITVAELFSGIRNKKKEPLSNLLLKHLY